MLKDKVYNYIVYGINIDSEIEVPQFNLREPKEGEQVVSLMYGDTEEDINKEIAEGRRMFTSRDSVWFHVDGVATYFINRGQEVIVAPCDNCEEALMKIYLMGSVLGFLLLQRQVLAIHGGTTVINGQAVIFTGDRGAGKSTLTTALGERGYKFLADDVAAISIESCPKVEPGFPYHKLCEDAVEQMNYDKDKLTFFRGDGKIKYLVPDFQGFCGDRIELIALFEIKPGEVERVEVQEIRGNEKFNKLMKNIYRYEYLSQMGPIPPRYFKQCMEVAKNIKCYTLIRPREGYTVEEQMKIIEEVLINNEGERRIG